jgi:DNA-directed RNA polymerase subunit RPC12/RpoP
MQEQALDGHVGRPVAIDICLPCQSFWFDTHESMQLSPGGTLALFRLIGEHAGRRPFSNADLAKCPRCRARLRLTQDMQRATRFSYLRCPNDHGRLTTFFDFLREKDFIRPLTAEQLQELRQHVQTVNCSNCGAPVDVTRASACAHCGSPLAMLDLKQAAALVAQLQRADAREHQPIDPALPLALLRARRQVEAAFPHDPAAGWSPGDLVDAGIQAVASWLKRNA